MRILGKATLTVSLLLIGGLVMVTIRPAHAYLDPGSGSYLFQIAIASLVGVLVAFRHLWASLAQRVRGYLAFYKTHRQHAGTPRREEETASTAIEIGAQ